MRKMIFSRTQTGQSVTWLLRWRRLAVGRRLIDMTIIAFLSKCRPLHLPFCASNLGSKIGSLVYLSSLHPYWPQPELDDAQQMADPN